MNSKPQVFIPIITTERLILRQWMASDLEPFAKLNADTRVMEFFLKILSRQESDDLVKKISKHIERLNWGFWAVSLRQTEEFIGFIGLEDVYFKAPFNQKTPAVEIGWRLGFNYWGKGYATEGAKAALNYGFTFLNLEEIVSFTTEKNIRSRHVMEKIGMTHDKAYDFNHPQLKEDHPLTKHVLYRINKKNWQKQTSN